MRCFPAVLFCLLLIAPVSRADVPASLSLPVTVRDSRGTPLAGVKLTLQPPARITTTDGKGSAAFTGLPPGPYTVSLAPAGYSSSTLPITLAADATSSLTCVLEKSGGSAVTTQDAAGRHFSVIGPLIPIPINPPPEYLLTPPVPPGSGPAWRASQEDTLREAAFRYLFTANPFNAARRYRVVYLSLGYFPWGQGADGIKDPDAAFLRRFQRSIPPVRPVSALSASSKDGDNPAKRHWIIYRVSSFKWTNDAQVKIDCGSAMYGFKGTDNVWLDCALKNGRWEITQSVEGSA